MKKAFIAKKLPVIIILLVMLVILMFFLVTFRQTSVSYMEKTGCRDSIIGFAKQNLIPALSLRKDDFFEKTDCKKEKIEINPKQPKVELADLFRRWWFQVAEGRQRLFKKGLVSWHLTGKDEYLCAVLAEVTFKEPVKGFLDYLYTENVPGKSDLIVNYLTNGQHKDLREELESFSNLKEAELKRGEHYLLFFYSQGDKIDELKLNELFKTQYYVKYKGSDKNDWWVSALVLADLSPYSLSSLGLVCKMVG